MPNRNPGKKAFAAIIGIAAAVGVLSYVLFGLATPEPAINTPAYNNQGAPLLAITTLEEVQAKQNDTIANQTQTAQEQQTTKNQLSTDAYSP
jgi:uncharacterized membrane protein YjgN (DUF898 family)